MNRIRIILADDHVVVRQGLRALLNQQKDMLVVGEADDGLQLLDSVRKLRPDVVLVDLKMPNLNGIDTAGEIRKLFPNTHTVILTMLADRSYIERAMQAGACSYVLKDEDIGEICIAIRHAAMGDHYLSKQVSQQIPGTLNRGDKQLDPLRLLTLRERQVFQMTAEGKTNSEMARFLGISVRTVEGHRAHMMSKLGLKTNIDFVQFALKHGIFVEK